MAKYIVGVAKVGEPWTKVEVALLFPETMVHRDVARAVFGSPRAATGAGFFWLDGDEVHVHGESTSIGIKSRPGIDEAFIKRALRSC